MPRKKAPRHRGPDTLSRLVEFTAVKARVGAYAFRQRGQEEEIQSSGSIELVGTLDEPIRDLRDVEVVVHPTDDTTPGSKPLPWVGLVDIIKPIIRPVVFVHDREFDRIWVLALSGRLKHGHVMMTAPRYRTAYLTNVSFSTDPEE